jgi:hypothetical protein
MSITSTQSISNGRTRIIMSGEAGSLDDLWQNIPPALKENTPGRYILTGDVSLILNCRVESKNFGINYIGVRNGATIEFSDGSDFTFGNQEIASNSIAEIIGGIFQTEIETGWTFARMLKLMSSVLGGKITTKPDDLTTTFRNISDTDNALISVADSDSDRKQITYNIPVDGIYSLNKNNKPLYAEIIQISPTIANDRVKITAKNLKEIFDISYKFEESVVGLVRVNTEIININSVELEFSVDLNSSSIIMVGTL